VASAPPSSQFTAVVVNSTSSGRGQSPVCGRPRLSRARGAHPGAAAGIPRAATTPVPPDDRHVTGFFVRRDSAGTRRGASAARIWPRVPRDSPTGATRRYTCGVRPRRLSRPFASAKSLPSALARQRSHPRSSRTSRAVSTLGQGFPSSAPVCAACRVSRRMRAPRLRCLIALERRIDGEGRTAVFKLVSFCGRDQHAHTSSPFTRTRASSSSEAHLREHAGITTSEGKGPATGDETEPQGNRVVDEPARDTHSSPRRSMGRIGSSTR